MDLHRTKIQINLNPPGMNGFEFNMICKKEPVNENHPGALIQDPAFCEIGSRCKDEKEIKVEVEDPLQLSRTDIRKEPEEQTFPGLRVKPARKRVPIPRCYNCDKCRFLTRNFTDLKYHMIIVHKVFLKLINESDKENNSFSSHPINFPTFQLHALAALTTREEPYTVHKPGNTSTIDLKPKLEKIMKPAEPNIRKPDFRCKKCTVICQTSQLKHHLMFVHNLSCFSCDRCSFVALHNSTLYSHMKSKHLGVRYPCDECDYLATSLCHIKRHKLNIHNGSRYPCNICEYIAKDTSNLRRHVRKVHKVEP
ncbi:RE1-silencing transcription factor B isoform X4 [Eurytemora carolleeae]|uniref:RE1-silencing transcription factor B isoform X4 n=1 Tax=Eurytemora carolleeae TaxID=1294199 RepID=UPI000C789E96|nr:RE1-silencing transcription factor B isoform X4 [Eurytemora carolleeae]|eukprot:XP_023326693.1 RE1-silencing transcription factor B-like isoform X4 [Eurytemora affinis]